MKYAAILGAVLLLILVNTGIYILFFSPSDNDIPTGITPAQTTASPLPPSAESTISAPRSSLNVAEHAIQLTHMGRSDYADTPYEIYVYPPPNTSIPLADYNRGMVFDDLLGMTPYPIGIFAQIISDFMCLPPQFIQGTPSEECHDLKSEWSGTDFRPYVQIYLDGEIIRQNLSPDSFMEELDPIMDNAFYFCYRVPLLPGVHTMRYEFTLPEENIRDTAEWSFTITP